MEKVLFDLSFNHWASLLLALVPALINLIIFLYISFFFPKNETNRTLAVFILLLFLWEGTD
ncbi:MAG TPA: hypothetical protein VGO45_05965, partial [Bacteroidia bacterium]|nr:hypothetical protein [Bacteroidia bacterium]